MINTKLLCPAMLSPNRAQHQEPTHAITAFDGSAAQSSVHGGQIRPASYGGRMALV